MKRFRWKSFFLFIALLAACVSSFAATITVTNNVNWNSLSGGSGPNGAPNSTDDIIVKRGRVLTVNVATAQCNTLQLGANSGGNTGDGTLAFSAGASQLTVSGIITLGDGNKAGSINMTNGGTLVTQGFSVVNLGTWTAGAGTVQLTATNTLPGTSGFGTFNNLTINGSGIVTDVGQNTTVSGTLTLANGTLAIGANTLTLNGPAIAGTATNLAATASSSLVFGGSSSGVILPANVTQLNNLTINNANGVTLNASTTINGTLALVNGVLTTGSSTLSVANNCTAGAVQRTSGFVSGNLKLKFPSGSNPCRFDVGSGTAYAPIDVTTPTLSTGGTLTGSTTGSEHPDIANSGIDVTKDANRYWTLSGDTINAGSYAVKLNYDGGDPDAAATPTNFIMAEYDGTAWTKPTSVAATALSTSSANISGPLSNASFVVGESLFVCSVPAGMPSTMTCVCDNFGRTSLNPSTIYGGNWTLSSSSGSFGVPSIVNSGYLRMTDNSQNVATAATMPGTFPAAGNIITVEFKHYAYNGSGADGIALTLSDASQTPTPGAYGGSLGYAQKDNASCAAPPCNGFVGGWVGVGIDEFGNYSNPSEGRSGGPGSRPDSIAVRGSGSGLTGYPYLAGTGSLGPGVDNAGSPTAAYGHAYRITVDARCYQRNANPDIACNNASLSKKTQVSVNRDTTGAGSFSATNRIVDFDAYAVNPSQANVPQNWKLSFTGSTGGLVNIHELQGLKICAQTITPPAGYRIQVDNLYPSTCATPGGSPSSPVVTITALDTNGNTITTYNKTINLAAVLSSGGASTATWRRVGTTANLPGNQYTFVAGDNGVAQFYLTDTNAQTVYLSASENGGSISTSLADGVQFSGATFTITNKDQEVLSDKVGGGVVAGRAHLMQVTRNNACSVDTAYKGSKNLDGWYSPANGDHPGGALAPQLCAPNANGNCLPTTGACQALSIGSPAINAASNFMPALSFGPGTVNNVAVSGGVATFCIATADVGKYSIGLRDDSATSAVVGSSDMLTVRPFAVAVTDVKQAATSRSNPADGTATGTYFADAGSSFEATIGGYLWSSAADTGNNGLPGPNVTKDVMTAAGIAPHYADTVKLEMAAPFSPAPPSDFDSAQPKLPGGDALAITGGRSTVAGLSYPEVGTFGLAAKPKVASYLNSGVDLTNRFAIFSNPGSNARTSLVGRFKPAYFKMDSPAITNRSTSSCSPASTFSYMGEPIGINFTLTAYNVGGAQTKNYAGDWAKLNPTTWLGYGSNNSIGLWMIATNYPVAPGTCKAVFGNGGSNTTTFACDAGVTPPAARTRAAGPRVGIYGTPVAPAWTNGTATFVANVVLERPDTSALSPMPDGPYETLSIGVAPQDADGVALQSLNLDADNNGAAERALLDSTKVRFGRLRLFNAVGSERLYLPVGIQTEYWNGQTFVTNADDNCTRIPATSVIMNGQSGGLNTINMRSTNFTMSGAPFVNGIGNLRINKPTSLPTSKGTVNLCIDLGPDTTAPPGCTSEVPANFPWLQGKWSGAPYFDDDPFMRATFGVYRGGPTIYMREMY
jgi:MSHA biogenesis protein MshQ